MYLQMVEVVKCVVTTAGPGVRIGLGVSVTGYTVVVIGIRVVDNTVLLAGQFLTFGGHLITVYVEVEPDIEIVSMWAKRELC